MVISLDGVLIRYIDYSHHYAIKSNEVHPTWTDDDGWTDSRLQSADPSPIIIPIYQRKLVWKRDDIENLFLTEGKLLGNITFANNKIPDTNRSQLILVDGLQRFSAITAIMRSLYNNVLHTNPTYPGLEIYFEKISDTINKSMPTIWQHNHEMLLKSGRLGIRSSYQILSEEVNDYIIEQLQRPSEIEKFALMVHNTLFNKLVAINTFHNFENSDEIIETFKDVNSSGVTLTETDILRASIVLQAEKLGWAMDDISDGENRFTETFQPERDSIFNKTFRSYFGIRLSKAFKVKPTNVFPDYDKLTRQSLDSLFDYIDRCEDAQKSLVTNSEYKFPYLKEIFTCGSLPFIAFIWFYYANHYLKHLDDVKKISDKITENYKMEKNSGEEISDEHIESHLEDTIEKLKNVDDLINNLTGKLNTSTISDSRRKKLEDEKKVLEELKQKYHNYYDNLPDFLGGNLNTATDGLLFLRAAYRRVINGDIGTTAIIVDRLMNKEIKTMQDLAIKFNPASDAGELDAPPNDDWLKSRLMAKKGTNSAKPIFNACLLPVRDSGNTDFYPLVYGPKTDQWNIDHLIPKTRRVQGEGNTESEKIVNFAPLDKAHNLIAQNIACDEKLRPGGVYDMIKQSHPYCKWLSDKHYTNHQNDKLIQNMHPLNLQRCLVHSIEPPSIGDERIIALVDLLTPKL